MSTQRITARYRGICGDCNQPFPKGAQIEFDKEAPRGLKAFHVDCSNPDANHVAPDNGFKYFPGDNRPFVKTRYGWRAGTEHTGVRCEDAPCCGCC